MYKQYTVGLNIPTLIVHNGRLANPLDPLAKAMKEVSGIRKKTDSDLQRLADLEYEGGLYLNSNDEPILPSRVLEAWIAEGAKKSREGKTALSSTFVDTDMVLNYDGGPLTVKELIASPDHRLTVPVRVTTSKVMRTRPIFRNVTGEFIVSVNMDLANAEALRRWVEAGLNQVGLGDWRPRHGRGTLVKFEEVEQPLSAVA